MTFPEFKQLFPTEKAAVDYCLRVRYGDTLTCPHCGAKVKACRCRKRAKACRRENCNNSFSPSPARSSRNRPPAWSSGSTPSASS
jgi:hypothetical protein